MTPNGTHSGRQYNSPQSNGGAIWKFVGFIVLLFFFSLTDHLRPGWKSTITTSSTVDPTKRIRFQRWRGWGGGGCRSKHPFRDRQLTLIHGLSDITITIPCNPSWISYLQSGLLEKAFGEHGDDPLPSAATSFSWDSCRGVTWSNSAVRRGSRHHVSRRSSPRRRSPGGDLKQIHRPAVLLACRSRWLNGSWFLCPFSCSRIRGVGLFRYTHLLALSGCDAIRTRGTRE